MIEHREEIESRAGWFESKAMDLFYLIDDTQKGYAVCGSIVEIGVYHGKSAAVLGQFLRPEENFYCVDTFVGYGNVEPNFRADFERWFEKMTGRRAIVAEGESSKVPFFPVDRKCRIWHIDGMHSFEDTFGDLMQGKEMLADGGVIIADDFLNPDWLAVGQAINYFLNWNPDFCLVAQGYNKTVICKKEDYEMYYKALKEMPNSPHNFLPFHEVKYLSLK